MTTFSSSTQVQADGARVETGVVHHEGKAFAALGSVVDVASGLVNAYVSENGGVYTLTTWEGTPIAPLILTGKWQQWGLGGVRNTIWAWRATVDGVRFSGRNSGPGMFIRMRAKV